MIGIWKTAVLASLFGGLVLACGSGDNINYADYDDYDAGDDGGDDGGDAGGITGDGGPSAIPMLAEIDPDATMVQSPGEGVGVFTEYERATAADPVGHWYIWWTCDTNLSNEPCPFQIQVEVRTGVITSATPQGFGANDTLGTGGVDGGLVLNSTLTAVTNTTTTVQGVRFDTDPGAVLTLSASLSGEYSGSFLFFVQDGMVNGGYKGALTNPLELQSTGP